MPVFTMNFRAALAGLAFFFFTLTAAAQVTVSPRIDRQSTREVNIVRVELTGSYTVLTFQYRIRGQRQPQQPLPPSMRDLFEPMYTSTIGFQPDSRLVVNVAGQVRSFRFIRAQGIPTDPDRQKVYPGDEGVFKVYFERLEPGMTVFDLYECRSEGSYTCWNYYGVHIINPLRRNTAPPRPRVTPQPAPPARSQPPAQVPPPVASRPVPAEPKGDVPVVVSGQVYDAVTKQPVDATLSYRGNGGVTDSARTIRNLGIYRLTLPKDKYNYTVMAPGYERLTEPLDLTQPAGLTQVDRDIYLKPQARATTPTPAPATPKPATPPVATTPPPARSPILTTPPVVGRKVELKNVLFETGKSTLLTDSYATLDDLAQWMKENPAVEIRLEGHTDKLGDSQKNLELSLDRVVAVKRYLTGKGIVPGRIQTKGYGDTRPITRGTSEAERQKNRRVEFVIVKS